MALYEYAPAAAPVVTVREEPPDSPGVSTSDVGENGGEESSSGSPNRRSPSAQPQHAPSSDPPYPECWFEDEESGLPLRWQLFVGVLYDLMRGRNRCDGVGGEGGSSTSDVDGAFLLPWKLRVHFTSYPSMDLLPLDAAEGSIPLLVERTFRNSLKQASFLQHGSSKVAMSLSKQSQEKMWDAVLRSNFGPYREVDVDLHQDGGEATEAGVGIPRRIPIRVLVNGAPAMQRPCSAYLPTNAETAARVDGVSGNGNNGTKGVGNKSLTTLGDVLAEWLPHLFGVTISSASDPPSSTAYFVQGVCPSLSTPVVELWRALCHPDHFLYVIVVTAT